MIFVGCQTGFWRGFCLQSVGAVSPIACVEIWAPPDPHPIAWEIGGRKFTPYHPTRNSWAYDQGLVDQPPLVSRLKSHPYVSGGGSGLSHMISHPPAHLGSTILRIAYTTIGFTTIITYPPSSLRYPIIPAGTFEN